MVYIIGWAGMLLVTFLDSVRGSKFFGFLVLTYLTFLAFSRGLVGTDTVSYISIFELLANSESVAFGEIGFKYLAIILLSIFTDAELAVKAVSLVFFALLGIYYLRSTKDEAFLFVSYILPVFAYSYSMNGLRIGIGFAIFLIVFQILLRNGFYFKKIWFLILPVFFHYSTILFPLIIFLYKKNWLSIRFIMISISVVILSSLVFFIYGGYFSDKLALYGNYAAPSMFSGVRNVIPLLLVLVGVSLGRLPFNKKIQIIVISFLLLMLAMSLVQVSYAGLRVLDLLSSIIPLMTLYFYRELNLKFDKNIKLFFILAGLLYALATYRGFVEYYGVGGSPFLPYTFSF